MECEKNSFTPVVSKQLRQNQKTAQILVFLLFGVHMDDRILQVLPGGGRCKEPQILPQFRPEIVADVGNDLLLGRGREARDGDGGPTAFLLPELADEVADVKVIDAEILSPRGKQCASSMTNLTTLRESSSLSMVFERSISGEI